MSAPRPPEVIIRSAQHPAVKEARRLEADAGARRKEGRAVAWGRHLAIEALAAGIPIERAFLAPGVEDDAEGERLAAAIARAAVPALRVAKALLDGIAAGAGDQGIVLVLRRPSMTLDNLLARRPTLLLLAHGVQDPGNLGSMIRSARALGADAMGVLEGSADPWSSRALRAAMGAAFHLPIVEAESGPLLAALRRAGLRVVAAASAATTAPAGADLRGPVALLLGREGAGLPPSLLDAADATVGIPMQPEVDSLNVHAAAAILLYEARRQRDARP